MAEVHILWITAGLGCDGDSVSITAATQPSIEDVLLGAIPGLPKVHLHNPVLAYEDGDDFMKYWYQAEEGKLDPFVLVVEGSIPNEKIKSEGYWAALGTDPDTGQPITTNEWIDRLAPKALAVMACGTCATYGGIHAMEGNPTGAWAWPIISAGTGDRRPACRSSMFPAARCSPTTSWRPLLYLLYQVAGLAPMIPLDDQLRPTWLFGKTVHEGCDRAGYYEQGDFADELRLAQVHREAGLLGPGGELQRAQARLDGAASAAARTSAASASAAPCPDSPTSSCRSWTSRRARRFRPPPIGVYGKAIRALRSITNDTVNKEPKWRHPRAELTTGYHPKTY